MYREVWLIWRKLGSPDVNGNWVAPVSFVESLGLPARMLAVFDELDEIVAKMQKQTSAKKKKGKK